MESFTTSEVVRLLGLSPTQVRSQARAGFLTPERGPRNNYRFSFQDLVLLRTARELARARVRPARIRNALRDLARQLPADCSLSGIRITADGRRVLVHDGAQAWNPESGQLQIDFAALQLSTSLTLGSPAGTRSAALTAEDWFQRALDLEVVDLNQANHAYAQALSLDPAF